MAFRVTTVPAALILACGGIALLAGCGSSSNGIQVQQLNTDDARRALSNIAIDLPDGFEVRDFTSSSSFTGHPALWGRFDGTDSAEIASRDFNRLNPDAALQEVSCASVPGNAQWRRLGFICSDSAMVSHFRASNGNDIKIALQSDDAGSHLFVVTSGT
ncbi:MAG: hypothetical protein U5O16_12325 [Rhodococcus sp. (in: high G+C Gram-positive bacteria)]|uniref:hypothetical protein n=1 Tax=Rhodococcus sp. TaxID=1831 RepID=UPI002AD5BF63|nr:hypothetical protein [Rhodococcus sp. (in: high G+C Gram-positive bacteria)]